MQKYLRETNYLHVLSNLLCLYNILVWHFMDYFRVFAGTEISLGLGVFFSRKLKASFRSRTRSLRHFLKALTGVTGFSSLSINQSIFI